VVTPDATVDRRQADVVVIGAGAAGICAAIEAASFGARVVALDAGPSPGGAAAISSGLTCVVDSPLQRALGIRDSVRCALADWMTWGGPSADRVWARLYVERSASHVFEWLRRHGVEWVNVIQTEGNSVPRQHEPVGGGPTVVGLLLEEAARLGVEIRVSTSATRLLVDDGVLVGVATVSPSGSRVVDTRAAVVASGGFANSPSMLGTHGPRPGPGSRLLRGGAEHALGTGHELLSSVGAVFVGMDRVWTYAYGIVDPEDPTEERGLAFWATNDIWVNADGRRFHDESKRGGATATPALFAQTPATCWSIFDSDEALRATIAHPRFRNADGTPSSERVAQLLGRSRYAHSALTIPELAHAAGIPSEALANTVGELSDWFANGVTVDPRFGRNLQAFRPLTTPPFYAVQMFPLARKCLGGVRTNRECRVIQTDGSHVMGLYAAGEVAGMAGGHMNGQAALEGTMLGPSMFSGRLAARAALRALGYSARDTDG
jgi:predicted oxidoreductase